MSAMVTGVHCSSNSHHSRAREVARSGANERGRREDSIPYLTYRGDASWRSNFAEEVMAAGLFCFWAAVLFMAALDGAGACKGGTGGERGSQGRARRGNKGLWRHGGIGRWLCSWRARAGKGASHGGRLRDAAVQGTQGMTTFWGGGVA
jgi:hypothetical protein